jgi:hypothetical protein
MRKIQIQIVLLLEVCSLRCRTPRTLFVINEDRINSLDTDPPIRGVQFHLQTLSSFLASKVQGVLYHLASLVQIIKTRNDYEMKRSYEMWCGRIRTF